MKNAFTALVLLVSALCVAQNKLAEDFAKANFLLQSNHTDEAYTMLSDLRKQVTKTDTLYNYVTWYYVGAATELEGNARMAQDYTTALKYANEAIAVIKQDKALFDENFAAREYWMTKNIIVSLFGLGKYEEAQKQKEVLYAAYDSKTLPEGIDGYFNFDFFKLDDKNIWGYEWYPKLPENRFSSTFTKVVYYVYSTNPDGSDKDQLYRLHVLMFHQDPKDAKFDYILEKQRETDGSTVSGSYYQYNYKETIDYKKLHNDVIEIVKDDIRPDTNRTVKAN